LKRDLYLWKETYTSEKKCVNEKRPKPLKRDLYLWKETYTSEKKCVNEMYIQETYVT